MSVARCVMDGDEVIAGEKIVLPRTVEEIWSAIDVNWAGKDHRKWRALAMLCLAGNCGWTFDMIGKAFDLNKSNVCREISAHRKSLCQMFKLPAFELPDDEDYESEENESAEVVQAVLRETETGLRSGDTAGMASAV